jgi:hypothetical protein
MEHIKTFLITYSLTLHYLQYRLLHFFVIYLLKRRILKNDILLLPKDQSINGTVKHFEDIKVEK